MQLDDQTILDAQLDTVYELLNIFKLEMGTPYDKEDKLIVDSLDACIDKIKYGVTTKFYIMHSLADNFEQDDKNQIVWIPNKRIGKPIPTEEYLEEMESRKIVGKQLLLKLNAEDRFFKPNQE